MTACLSAVPVELIEQLDKQPREPVLETRGVTKSFPGVKATDDVSIAFMAGTVHVLFGENGAGKSTFINMLAGALKPDSGQMLLDGIPRILNSVHEARRLGIAAVFQEFSLSPDLTVADNLVLGNEPMWGPWLNKRAIKERAHKALAVLGFDIDPCQKVALLSRAEQQMVEIAKTLLANPRVLILDEPTASLTEQETRRLFDLIRELKSKGVAIIYISHRMPEIIELGDVVTVLRDGRKIVTLPVAETNPGHLVELMLGRSVTTFFPHIDHKPTEICLSLRNVSSRDGVLRNVSLEVRAGEIVGLAGLVGCGKSEIGRACFGLIEGIAGEISVLGKTVRQTGPRDMLLNGLSYLPGDRRREGLLLSRPIHENITLPILDNEGLSWAGFLRHRNVRQAANDLACQMQVRPLDLNRAPAQLSGGNQQKVVLAKTLARGSKVVILDEPTVGVDVGSKSEIYEVIAEIARSGAAVLLISSELPEVINLSHRVYVIQHGVVLAHLEGERINEEVLLRNFFSDPKIKITKEKH